MRTATILTLALILCINLFAQENMFVVYSTKGTVTISENKVESKAKIGALLNNGSVIKVGPGSFATLICNETRMFTLSKSGTYNLGTMMDSCKAANYGSVSSNYLKYVWNEMTRSKGSPEKNRKAFMSNVGAVSRTINDVWIDPKLDTINYVSGSVPLSWKSYVDSENFEFKLFDKEGKNILTKTTGKKHVNISEISGSIKPGNAYWWTAMVKGGANNDDRKYLSYWNKSDYDSYYSSLKEGDASENEAESNFRLGFLLEEAHFLAEAQKHYLKATQLAPDVIMYRSTYMSFKKDYEIK